jgi:hypothetical protein
MGCNSCKGGRAKPLNNVNNQDTLKVVKEIYDRVIVGKEINDFNDFDKLETFNAYNMLYPNSSQQPDISNAIHHITHALQFLVVNKTKIKR